MSNKNTNSKDGNEWYWICSAQRLPVSLLKNDDVLRSLFFEV